MGADPEGFRPQMTEEQAATYARLPMNGLLREFPNKPSNVMASKEDVRSPAEMHPAFFGNFDWHSSVHGHWMLVRLLRIFPHHRDAAEIRNLLNNQLTLEKMQAEARYFDAPHNKSFERMYGWAWLLQLVRELHAWDDDSARQWRENIRPLEDSIVSLSKGYLPRLSFPIRVGTHTDTAFALSMLLDYARTVGDEEFADLIERKARDFFLHDVKYPSHYEPSGHDFFSPGFNEADLMRRVLTAKEFSTWLSGFLPDLGRQDLGPMAVPVEVTDLTDGHLVHLAGLDLSRAWTMRGIASVLPADDGRRELLMTLAAQHAQAGLKYVNSGHYEGDHWLATFAVYYLTDSGLDLQKNRK